MVLSMLIHMLKFVYMSMSMSMAMAMSKVMAATMVMIMAVAMMVYSLPSGFSICAIFPRWWNIFAFNLWSRGGKY